MTEKYPFIVILRSVATNNLLTLFIIIDACVNNTRGTAMSGHEIELLKRLRFKNSGVVRRDTRFEYHTRPCYYMEDVDQWTTPWSDGYYSYLYEVRGGELVDPPSGMRSSVPLGGLGTGTVELRADGGLRDWNIFNNSPAGGQKVHLDDALFMLRTQPERGAARSWTLRTHPPKSLPAIEQIEYGGAHPVSRLRFADPALPVSVTLYARSELHLRDADASATPAILFDFVLENPTDQAVDVSLLFNLPNHIGGQFSPGDGLTLTRPGDEPTSGTMAVRAAGTGLSVGAVTANSLHRLWQDFDARGEFWRGKSAPTGDNPIDSAVGKTAFNPTTDRYGALSARARLAPGETRLVTFVLAWHFPNRTHNGEIIGNHYTNLYADAGEVAEKALARISDTLEALHEWQGVCSDNTLPEWLQDAMVNSVATTAKTGFWTADGRWRQWESFSCAAVDPIHIHFYRDLPYAWFFRALRLSELRAYGNAKTKDGYIQENLGHSTTELDRPSGRNMGDGCTTFILEVYQDYVWTGDRAFLDEIWPHAKKAAEWQLGRCATHGLPNNLDNSYDWWSFADKDLCSYNAFLHLAAILAAERLAAVEGDDALAQRCRDNVAAARKALAERLWTGDHFRSWWMKNADFPDALHADTLYGELWARILGLGPTTDEDRLRSHLAAEFTGNGSPFGLRVMQGTDCDDDRHPEVKAGHAPYENAPINNIVWEAGSLDWCSLQIYLGGDVQAALAEAGKVINKWREKLRDQWDYRDLTTGWDGYPWCNSHYARQLMLWAIPLALSGQTYSAADGTLAFDPKVPAPATLPFFTPAAAGTLDLAEDGRATLTVLSGRLELKRLRVGDLAVDRPTVLDVNDALCLEPGLRA